MGEFDEAAAAARARARLAEKLGDEDAEDDAPQDEAEDDGTEKHRCDVCGREFTTAQGLGSHKRAHRGKGGDAVPVRLRVEDVENAIAVMRRYGQVTVLLQTESGSSVEYVALSLES